MKKTNEIYLTLEEDLVRVFRKRLIDVEKIIVEKGATKYTIIVRRSK
jgi:hypothetical protein